MFSLPTRYSNRNPLFGQALNCQARLIGSSLALRTTRTAVSALNWPVGTPQLYSSRPYKEIEMHFGEEDKLTPEEREKQEDIITDFISRKLEQRKAQLNSKIVPMSQEEYIKTHLGSYEEFSKKHLELAKRHNLEKFEAYIKNPQELLDYYHRLCTKGYEGYKRSFTKRDLCSLF